MTRAEVAEYLRISVKTVDRWAGDGRLARHYLGAEPRFRIEDVRALVNGGKGAA